MAIIYITTTIIWITIFIIHIYLKLSLKSIITLKGYEYIIKLLAQKEFLDEFTIISSRGIEEQKLWKHYIYMAILYGLRGKLDDEAKTFYIDTIKQVSYDDRYKTIPTNLFTVIMLSICYLPFLVVIFSSMDGPLLLRLFDFNFILVLIMFFYLLKVESQ